MTTYTKAVQVKECKCGKSYCKYLLFLEVSRIGDSPETVFEESCDKAALLRTLQDAKKSGWISGAIYDKTEDTNG